LKSLLIQEKLPIPAVFYSNRHKRGTIPSETQITHITISPPHFDPPQKYFLQRKKIFQLNFVLLEKRFPMFSPVFCVIFFAFVTLVVGQVQDYSSYWVAAPTYSSLGPDWNLQIFTKSSQNKYAGERLVLKIHNVILDDPSIPITPIENINFKCTQMNILSRSALTHSLGVVVAPVFEPGSITELSYTHVNPFYDLAGWSCSYRSVSPIHIEFQLYVSLTYTTEPNWVLWSTYHHSGMLFSSRSILPPLSWSEDPNGDPNRIVCTLYQIHNGLFDLNIIVILFDNYIFSDPLLHFSVNQMTQYPQLIDATVDIVRIDEGVTRFCLLFDGIPRQLETLTFSIRSVTPYASIGTIQITSALRTQMQIPGVLAFGGLARQYKLPLASYPSPHALISISKSNLYLANNGIKLQFSLSLRPQSLAKIAFMDSSLTNFIHLLTCAIVNPPVYATFVDPYSRAGWFFTVNTPTASTTNSVFIVECEAVVSSLLSTYTHPIDNQMLFDIIGTSSELYPQPSLRQPLLASLFSSLTPFTVDIRPGLYFSRPHHLTGSNGAPITLVGSAHTLTVSFPGVIVNGAIEITIPASFGLGCTQFTNNSGYITFVSTAKTSRISGPFPAAPTLLDNVQFTVTVNNNPDGTVTWSIPLLSVDVLDLEIDLEIFRTMSRSSNTDSYDSSSLTYIDTAQQPIDPDLDRVKFSVIQHSPRGLPNTIDIPELTRTFDIPIGPMPLHLPPVMTIDDPDGTLIAFDPSKLSFQLYFEPIPVQSDPFSAYTSANIRAYAGQIVQISLTSSWSDQFTINSVNVIDGADFGIPSQVDGNFAIEILHDMEINSRFAVFVVELSWSSPSAIPTAPRFDIRLISGSLGYGDVNYLIRPSFSVLSMTSTVPQIVQSDPSNLFTSIINHTDDTGDKFIVNNEQKLDIQIQFHPNVRLTANFPTQYTLSFTKVDDFSPFNHHLLETFDSTDFTIDFDTVNIHIDLHRLSNLALGQHVFVHVEYNFIDESALGLSLNGLNPTQTTTSPWFTIVQPCLSPVGAQDFAQTTSLSTWKSLCGNHGQCNFNGRCRCSDKYTGPSCNIEPDLCESNGCVDQNTFGCDRDGQCVCRAGWAGAQCNVSQDCIEQSDKHCSGRNGFLIPDGSICGKTCQCLSNWIGKSCELCSLQCQNGGKPYKTCNQCGCVAGFSGQTCQCRRVTGQITINAYNQAHLDYVAIVFDANGKIASSESDFIALSLLDQYNTLYNHLTTHIISEMELDPQTDEIIALGKTVGGTFATGVVLDIKSMKSEEEEEEGTTKYQTKFSISIFFGCQEYNIDDTTETINTKWDDFVNTLIQSEVIQHNFIFSGEPQATTDGLREVDSTLPSDPYIDSGSNASNWGHLGNLFVVVGMLLFVM
jgi:hypothetical protein